MNDRELFKMALAMLEDINQCSLPPTGIPLPAEIDEVMEALRSALAQPERAECDGGQCGIGGYCKQCPKTQPEPEPVATLFGSLPVYDVPLEQQPVAWVETLENAQPHCVTDLKYCSVMQHDRGEHLKYTPLYKDPTPCKTCEALARTVMLDQTSHDTKKEWVGLTDAEYEAMAEQYVTNCYFDTLKYAKAIEAKLKEKNAPNL